MNPIEQYAYEMGIEDVVKKLGNGITSVTLGPWDWSPYLGKLQPELYQLYGEGYTGIRELEKRLQLSYLDGAKSVGDKYGVTIVTLWD